MNISAPFIARPVATWLLAIAIMLAGILAYRALPVSALPEVDFPTVQVTTQLPGASPETVETLITASLERQFGQIPGLVTMTSQSSEGTSQITLQFNLNRYHGFRGAGRPGGDQRRGGHFAGEPSLSAGLRQGQPGGRADPDPGARIGITADRRDQRRSRHVVATETFRDRRRGSRYRAGRDAPGGARARRSRASRRLWPRDGRCAHRGRQCQCERRQRRVRRTAARVRTRRQRPAGRRGRLSRSGHHLAQGCAGATVRHRQRGQRRGERPRCGVVQGPARGGPRHPAPARRQHRADSPAGKGRTAAPAERHSFRHQADHRHRPDRDNPRVGPRCSDHADHVGRAGRAGDLCVPPLAARHIHPCHCPAAVADRHLRRDAATRLRARQPLADGADRCHGLRGRRCDRDDREHRALHRAGHAATGGSVSRRGTDRLHHRLADGLADRGVHPAAVHDRRGRPPVQGVRGHPLGRRGGVGSGLADPDPDDVRSHPPAGTRRTSGPHRPHRRGRFQRDARRLPEQPGLDIPAPADGAGDRNRHARRYGRPLCGGAEGFPAATGHRCGDRRHRGGTERVDPTAGVAADAGGRDRRA